jgi:uncharacterized protein YlxW (UPF0749 family)
VVSETSEPDDGSPRRELMHQLAFQPGRPHLLIGLMFVILGLLVTVSIVRPGHDNPWQNARTEDLVQILDGLGARQGRLDTETARLTALRADLERGSTAQALADAQRKVSALQVLAGTTPVRGPGLSVTVTDPQGAVDAPVLLDAVQELRDAGAEAVQVGPTRVVAGTWFADSPEGPTVNGVLVPRPITINAIGNAETMAAALRIPGGLADSVRTRGAEFEATPAQSMTISVTVPNTTD